MAVSCVGYILNCLKKDSLVSICQERGLSYSGNKPALHHRLRSSFGSKPIELLTFLSKKQLKLICKKSELPVYGNIDQLIDRIMSLDVCEHHHTIDFENDYSDDESYSEEDFDETSEDRSSNISLSTSELENL